jgi:indolepyruvate ferredoxin oxidoreductase beta subunit
LKKDGILIVNDTRIDPMTVVIGAKEYPENIIENLKAEHKVYAIDGLKIAKELGNSKVLNSVVLGLSAKHIGFTEEEWIAVIEKTVPPKTIEINKLAFKRGYEN